MSVLGLDIGGANLKISDGESRTVSVPFPLWKQPEKLAEQLTKTIQLFPTASVLAVTMTGELADCFPTRRRGVHDILTSVKKAAAEKRIVVWQTSGEFVSLEEAWEFPILSAAGNWHALATWAGRMAPQGASMLIDIGSTTTDLIPIEDGVPLPLGRTDFERLSSHELLYLGTRRTPLCALISEITLESRQVGVAREVFATSLDAHLWLQQMTENPLDCQTANGRPASREEAGIRLARIVCSDRDDLTDEEITEIARTAVQREVTIVREGLLQVLSRIKSPRHILLSGEGEFLAREVLNSIETQFATLSLAQCLGPDHSQGACAFALARLARERA